jgi:hypothetical protein
MAINSLSTGWRPGVCTSSTRPTAPYEGQVIYETDTDLSYVWGGAAWQQVSGGTAVGNSGLVYISSGSFSGAVSFDVTGFTSDYLFYELRMSIGSASATGITGVLFSGATARNTTYYGATFFTSYLGTTGVQDSRNAGVNFYVTDCVNAPPTLVTSFIRGIGNGVFATTIQAYDTNNTRSLTGAYSNYAATNSFDKIRFTGSSNLNGSWSLMGVRKA